MDKETKIPNPTGWKSPTEVLIKSLEDFGRDEPWEAILVWTTESGDIAWCSSTPMFSVAVGMLEVAKRCILKKLDGS